MVGMKRFLTGNLILIFLCGSGAWQSAHAITMNNLYEVQVPVKDQSRNERKESIKVAFQTLLVRLTGNEGIGTMEQVIALSETADQYVRQFRYEQEPVPLLDIYNKIKLDRLARAEREPGMFGFVEEIDTELTRSPDETRQVLAVKFDEKAVNELIWSNRLPFWGKGRPAAVVWLAIQDSKGRFLLDTTGDNLYLEVLRAQARTRGIPLVFPLQDFQDQVAISVGDVWGNFESTIRKASARYETDTILAGRLTRDIEGQWHGRWTLYRGKERLDYEIRSDQIELALAEGVRQFANVQATRYAHVTTGEEEDEFFLLHIAGVSNLGDYNRATRHVKSLSAVAGTQVAQVTSDSIVLRLNLRGNQQAFEQAARLGGKLDKEPPPAEVTNREMFYRLQP